MFNSVFNKRLGNYIVRRRATLKINQAELAEKLGFSAQFLGRIEKGNARLPLPAFRKVAKLLKFNDFEVRTMAVKSASDYLKKVLGA